MNRVVDWVAIHARLAAARRRIEDAWEPPAAEAAAILRARARLLAREPEAVQQGDSIEILELMLGKERYAIENTFVREIQPLVELTAVPCTPPFVLGVISLRGEIISVIDLRYFFDIPPRGLTNLDKVVVLVSPHMCFAVLADEILGIRRIPTNELQPPPPTFTGIREKYLRGLTRERTALLNAEALLGDRELVVGDFTEKRVERYSRETGAERMESGDET